MSVKRHLKEKEGASSSALDVKEPAVKKMKGSAGASIEIASHPPTQQQPEDEVTTIDEDKENGGSPMIVSAVSIFVLF